MFDLHIERNEKGIYEVAYKTEDKQEAFKICDILEALNEQELMQTYEVLEKKDEDYEAIEKGKEALKEKTAQAIKEIENKNKNIIDDSEYDINTNTYRYKDNNQNSKIDFNICPLPPFKNTRWALVSTVYLKIYYKNPNLRQEYKEAILQEWKKRGEDENNLIESKDANIDNKRSELTNKEETEIKKAEINKKIEEIKRGRDLFSLSDDELKKIIEIDIYDDTVLHILKGREFNRKQKEEREKEEKQKKEILKENKDGIIEFGESDSKEKENKESEKLEEDPLSKNNNDWSSEDLDGEEYMFGDDEEDGFRFE